VKFGVSASNICHFMQILFCLLWCRYAVVKLQTVFGLTFFLDRVCIITVRRRIICSLCVFSFERLQIIQYS